MRHVVLSLLILVPLVSSLGCHGFGQQAFDAHGDRACEECRADLGSGGRGGLLGALHIRHAQPAPQMGGPPIGAVTYPYYTVRGPRDFLQDQPTSIGP
ncbi:MAG: hypothetical protein ACC645_08095 [Pirellulales bacterium]